MSPRKMAAVLVYGAGVTMVAGAVGGAARGPYAEGFGADVATGAAILGGSFAFAWAAKELGMPTGAPEQVR